jgi:DNA-binding transcriptional MerR regulator
MCGISTVCELFDLTPRAVRFYEDRGLVQSGRDRFNCRKYDSKARARLEQIAAYRQAGLSIDDIFEIFSLDTEGEAAQHACAARKLKAKLVELERATHQAEALLQRHTSDRLVAVNTDSAVDARRVAMAR